MAVSVEALPTHESEEVVAARQRRRVIGFGVFAALAVVAVVLAHEVPEWMDSGIQDWAQDRYKWSIVNRQSAPMFEYFFNPISDFLDWSVRQVESLLLWLRWPGVVALTAAVGWRTGGARAAFAGGVAMFGVGVISDWDLAMRTLSIMTVAVVIALVLGVPLGIVTARSDRAERIVRVLLDTAQVMPIFVYFSPVQILFGIKFPPAVVVTVIYALPPAVRLTNLGLRQVPVVMNEVGESFGATSMQQLFKVQLPLARRTILLGLNQVIMMAFGVVVLASLLGTGDLGQVVLSALQKQQVGLAFAAGLGIVLMAVALDRVSTGERLGGTSWLARALPTVPKKTASVMAIVLPALAILAGRVFDASGFPDGLRWDISSPVDDAVGWVQDNLRTGVPLIGGTQAINDFLINHALDPVRDLLQGAPWLLVVVAFAFLGWLSKGWRLAATMAVCLLLIATMGYDNKTLIWDHAMDTLSQVLVAIVISIAIALPLGMWAGRSDRVERVLRPFLDIAQVLPQFVYLLPVVFLFSIGRAAGVVACVIYAIPPCIRLTSLGMREVPYAPREAAISFGATGRQEMRNVQLPLARKAILLGINQTMMMVLATVIIAALIGAGGLGLLAYRAAAKPQTDLGLGTAGGLSIVLLAIMLDRLTQAWGAGGETDRGA
ncbi:MAG: ABC transporter permease subunit [Actinomycetota bacterium]|nr:ABC transporter permease subunit [Actinomycetota bacterium]